MPSPPAQTTLGVPATAAAVGSSAEPSVPSAARLQLGRLVLDYPAAWRARSLDVQTRALAVLGFIGTADSFAGCWPDGAATACGFDLRLTPGTVAIAVSRPGGPPRAPMEYLDQRAKGSIVISVGGIPGVLLEDQPWPGADVALSLRVAEPGTTDEYWIVAAARDPAAQNERAALLAVLRSVRWDPRLVPLPTDAKSATAIAARTLARLGKDYACFPRAPGQTVSAEIVRLPFDEVLAKPLPVRCTTEIVPTPIGLWRLTLTAAWDAATGHTAGSADVVVWLAADGTALTTIGHRGLPSS